MFFIDTAAATIRPTQKCLEWVNAVAQKNGDMPLTLEQLRANPTVYLIPEADTPEQNMAYIGEKYAEIMEAELSSWVMSEDDFPENMSIETFWAFFEVEIHDMVVDLAAEEDDDFDEDEGEE